MKYLGSIYTAAAVHASTDRHSNMLIRRRKKSATASQSHYLIKIRKNRNTAAVLSDLKLPVHNISPKAKALVFIF